MRAWIRVNSWRTVISDHELLNYVTGKKRWIQWEIKHRLDTAIEPQSPIYCGYLVIRKREQKNVSRRTFIALTQNVLCLAGGKSLSQLIKTGTLPLDLHHLLFLCVTVISSRSEKSYNMLRKVPPFS